MTDWIDNFARRMGEAFRAPTVLGEVLEEALADTAPAVESVRESGTPRSAVPTLLDIPRQVTGFFRKMSVFSNITVQRARLESMRNELAGALRFEDKKSASYSLVHDAVREVEDRLADLISSPWDEDHPLDLEHEVDRTVPEQAKIILTAVRLKRARLQSVGEEHSKTGFELTGAESELKQLEDAYRQLKRIGSPAAKDVSGEIAQKKSRIEALKRRRSLLEAEARAQDLVSLVPLAEAVLREERVTASLADHVRDAMAGNEAFEGLDVQTRDFLERRIIEGAIELMDRHPKMTVDTAVKQATYDVTDDVADASSGVESKKTLGPRAWEDEDKAREKDFDFKKIAEKAGR